MRKRFMTYDSANPPAGVSPDGVFQGGGGIVITCSTDDGVFDKEPVFDFTKVRNAILNGEHVVIIGFEVMGNSYDCYYPADVQSAKICFYSHHDTYSKSIVLKSDNTATCTAG